MIVITKLQLFAGILRFCCLAALHLLYISSSGQSLASCKCAQSDEEYPYEEIGAIGSKHHKIQVCGHLTEGVMNEDSTLSDLSWKYHLHSAIVIHDCKTGDTLFMQEEMMDSKGYQIGISENDITLTEVTFINSFGFDSKDPPVPVTTTTISLRNGKVVISKPMPAFVMPSFSKEVLDSAKQFYHQLDSILTVRKFTAWVNYNQYPGDLLVVAALKNIGRSRELYRHLRKYFDLDGGISETYDSEYLDHLLDNMIKK